MRLKSVAVALIAVIALSGFGCATKQELRKSVGELRSLIDNNGSQIAALDKRVAGVEGAVKSNTESINALKKDVDGMKSSLDSLIADLEKLKGRKIVNKTVLTEQVSFGFDKWALTDQAKSILDEVASKLSGDEYFTIVVTGHADAVGSNKYNFNLGMRRAWAVSAYLAGKSGVDPGRVSVLSYGEEIPTDSNDTAEGRGKNRRAEIIVYQAVLE